MMMDAKAADCGQLQRQKKDWIVAITMRACSNEQEANCRDVVTGVRRAKESFAPSKCGGWLGPEELGSERVRVDSSPWWGERQLVMVSESRGRVHKGSPSMRFGFDKDVSGELQVSWDMGSGSSQLDETAGPSRSHVYEFFWPGNVIDRCIAVSGWGQPITAPNGPCPSRLITVPSDDPAPEML